MERATSKALAFAAAAVVVGLLLSQALRPAQYGLEYLRREAVEVARALEAGRPFKVSGPWATLRQTVVVEAVKPGEDPLRVVHEYRVLAAPAAGVAGILRGRPEPRWSRVREVVVRANGMHVVVEPKPLVSYASQFEHGRTVHVVTVLLVDVAAAYPGATLSLLSESRAEYLRTYDAPGEVRVLVGGDEALRFAVAARDALRLVVAREVWGP